MGDISRRNVFFLSFGGWKWHSMVETDSVPADNSWASSSSLACPAFVFTWHDIGREAVLVYVEGPFILFTG